VAADLGRLGVAWVGRRSVDLGGGGSDSVGRATNTSGTSTRAGRRRTLGWLRAHAISDGTLRIALLVLGLLGGIRMRRGDRESRWPLGHLMLRAHLLLLRRGVLLRRGKTCLVTAGHDAAEETVAGRNRWGLLGWSSVLGRSGNAGRRNAFASGLELVSKHGDFLFVLLLQSHVRLLQRINLFPNQLHFADLGRDLVLEAFGLAQVRIKLRSDPVEKLIKTSGVVGWRHATMRIHGHRDVWSDFVAVG
jgi:hypothetical protein